VIEQRLAEIVARDRQAKAAKQQEGTITAAIESAKQGNFEQAQQLLQDPSISPAVQTEVMGRINALKLAETPRLTPPATPVIVPVAPGTQSAVQQPTQPTPPTLATQPGTSPLALSPETRSPIARRFDLPGPKFAGAAPTENAGAGNGSQAGNYNTTPLGQQQATASPAMRYPGNSNVRLRYPLPTPEPITSPFGWRVHPVTGQRRLHTGTDIGAAEGTPILAAYSGKVSTADQLGGYGLAVVIEHNNGSQDTLYAHMSQILVRPGQWVEQGSVIGRVGSTGMSTGPHLHFELRHKTSDGWQTLDPGPYLLAAKNELIRAMQSAQSLPQPNQTAI
jgi:murein DD-endopeptidase MepM/ murein hydrolase activator NlpD